MGRGGGWGVVLVRKRLLGNLCDMRVSGDVAGGLYIQTPYTCHNRNAKTRHTDEQHTIEEAGGGEGRGGGGELSKCLRIGQGTLRVLPVR